LAPELREKARERLDAFVALSRAENVRTEFSVVEGTPAPVILEAAESQHADLICLGTHGREGFDRIVLGSVAEKVLRKAKCPVLTVAEAGEEGSVQPVFFKNIVCALDFATLSLRALEHALSLAQEAQAKLILLNVVEWLSDEPGWETGLEPDMFGFREQMKEAVLKKLEEAVPEGVRDWCDVETVVTSGKPYREILKLANEREADLIVMGVRGRNPLDRMLFGSTVQHVVRRAGCPVLTIAGGES
jgi:nucleotide-binding universal stress UspA family protein